MDEPAAGNGAEERHALMNLTARMRREPHDRVLFTEHDMDVVLGTPTAFSVLIADC